MILEWVVSILKLKFLAARSELSASHEWRIIEAELFADEIGLKYSYFKV